MWGACWKQPYARVRDSGPVFAVSFLRPGFPSPISRSLKTLLSPFQDLPSPSCQAGPGISRTFAMRSESIIET